MAGSNRTFMELKSATKLGKNILYGSSNRTFMELKYDLRHFNPQRQSVLIVPLWN